MRLTPPSYGIFLLSFILILGVLLSQYAPSVEIPVVSEVVSKAKFEVTLLAYILLFIGVVFRRL